MKFGPYRVLGRIATGGMGEVFHARSEDGEVALKLIRGELMDDPHVRRLFLAEAELGRLLDHPNIVRLVEFGEVRGTPFLAQELVDGVSLERLLENGPLPGPLAACVARQVLAALAYAHGLTDDRGRALKLVHRDVSAANVLVSRRGQVKLTDFGVAKIRGRQLTRAGEIKGQRQYMAPEQLVGGAVDQRTDVFAVGVLLYQMVVGEVPFDDVEVWLRSGARVLGAFPFTDVIRGALSIDARARPATAAVLARDIARAVTPGADGALQLAARVARVGRSGRALHAVDGLILAELSDSAPVTADRTPVAPPVHCEDTPTNPWQGVPLVEAFISEPTIVEMPDMPSAAPTEPLMTKPVTARELLPRERRLGWLVTGGAACLLAGTIGLVWFRRAPMPVPPPPRIVASQVRPPAPRPSVPRPVPPPPRPVIAAPPRPVIAAPPRREAVKPSPPRRPGFLTVDADPWATVYLDGRRLATTPFAFTQVPAGRHVVVLDLEDSGRKKTMEIEIVPDIEKRVSVRAP